MIRTILSISVLLGLAPAFVNAQTVDVLKKENEKLKSRIKSLEMDTMNLNAKLKHYEAISSFKALEIKGISNDINIQVLSCKGNASDQTVKIEFTVSHKMLHQSICIATKTTHAKAYDEIGNGFPLKASGIGTTTPGDAYGVTSVCDKIPTEVPVKAYAEFKNILPSTKLLTFVSVAFKFRNYDSDDQYKIGTLEIKNLKIQW
jgi:hypothetical protein